MMRRKEQHEISLRTMKPEIVMKSKYASLKDKLAHADSDTAKKQR